MQVFADATTRPSAGPRQRHREFIVMETPKHKRPSRPLGDGSAGHLDVVFVEPGSDHHAHNHAHARVPIHSGGHATSRHADLNSHNIHEPV